MIESQIQGRTDWNRIGEIKRTYHPKRTWNQFPVVRDQVLSILDIFHGSGVEAGDLLAKQISYLLSVAEARIRYTVTCCSYLPNLNPSTLKSASEENPTSDRRCRESTQLAPDASTVGKN